MWFTKTTAEQARELSETFADRRAKALEELKAKLETFVHESVLNKARMGQKRCILYFDRIYASDLCNDPVLHNDFTPQESELLEKHLNQWCLDQGLAVHKSNSNPFKVILRWQA